MKAGVIEVKESDNHLGVLIYGDTGGVGSLKVHNTSGTATITLHGSVRPGMLMGQVGTSANGKHPVALTGRVYCRADTSNGPIEPGDLLTTSDRPGHAMKVTDYARAQGAIIGKAMSSLTSGKGLVLVLISLQEAAIRKLAI